MRHLKMLGLAALAVTAFMAFLGASTASATVLCKTTPTEPNTNSCPSGWSYGVETPVHATVEGSVHLNAGFISNTCTTSTVRGKTTNPGSATETVSGPIEALTFENCSCPVTVIKKGSLEIHWTANSHNGTLTGKNSEVTVLCSNVTCIYGTAATGTDLGRVTSSATTASAATVDIEATLPKLGGSFLCPSTGEWVGSYTITEPTPLYVAETG